MCLAAVKYDLPAIIRVRHHDLVQRAQLFTKRRVGDRTAAGQGQHGVPRAEHPAFQRRGPRACPQVKSNAPPRDGRVGSLGGVLAFQHQVVYPHGVVVPDQPQRRRAHAAAAQVVPHGKVVKQCRALARQHDLPRIGQPCARVIGQKERLVDAGLQQALDLGKRLQLGGKQVSLVTSQDVQKLYRRLKENGRVREHPRFGSALSDTTINRLHAIFHQAMEDAIHAHIIAKNPTVGTTVPKASHAPKRVLTDKELDTFLDAVREDKIWGDFFYVELTTGLRRGEICGLMWQDFDARNGVLQVRRTLHNRKLGVDMLGKTKTRSGERTIVLPRSTAEILRRRKENAITQWIFPDPVRPELPLSPNCAYTHMKAILHKAGLPDIRFHDLRHTFATHAIASGVDAKTLSGILGHTNASFTLDTYTHVTPDMQKAASGIVGGFMEDLLGKGLRPWQRNGKAELAP